jgi:hypothetical protein
MKSAWDEIEQILIDLYSLPHNRIQLQSKNLTPQAAAKMKVDDAIDCPGQSNVGRESESSFFPREESSLDKKISKHGVVK